MLSSLEPAGWDSSYNSALRKLCKPHTLYMPQLPSPVK